MGGHRREVVDYVQHSNTWTLQQQVYTKPHFAYYLDPPKYLKSWDMTRSHLLDFETAGI